LTKTALKHRDNKRGQSKLIASKIHILGIYLYRYARSHQKMNFNDGRVLQGVDYPKR